ncbi:MAG: YrrC family ATP-dependent DNA helicase, partial [Sarcina sp.]
MEMLNGVVESIVFKSNDTGYTVLKLRDKNKLYTVVGAMPHAREGQNFKLTGIWTNHAQFGTQFKV